MLLWFINFVSKRHYLSRTLAIFQFSFCNVNSCDSIRNKLQIFDRLHVSIKDLSSLKWMYVPTWVLNSLPQREIKVKRFKKGR